MRALSIRQPYAELILRGIKTIEYRSRATKIIGERFCIYAARTRSPLADCPLPECARRIWSDDLAVPTSIANQSGVPAWMMELAEQLILDKLPTGVIVGSAVIEKVTRGESWFRWHLADVRRARSLKKPRRQPQPSWFLPF